MNDNPLVSIIVPAYNAEPFIDEAVKSVFHQTYANWELIIVNDGSTDGTRVDIDKLADPRIRIIHQKNMGVSAARNVGLSMAKGELITFLDADDVLTDDSIERRVDYLKSHPDVDVVDGIISLRDVSLTTEIRSYRPYYNGKLLPRLLKLDPRVFLNIVYMFRREKLDGAKFCENMTHVEDLLFIISLASDKNIRYGYVNQVVYLCRRSAGSAMSNMRGIESGYIQLVAQLSKLKNVSKMNRLYLRLKIAKILFLSWLAKKHLINGVVAAAKCLLITDRKNQATR